MENPPRGLPTSRGKRAPFAKISQKVEQWRSSLRSSPTNPSLDQDPSQSGHSQIPYIQHTFGSAELPDNPSGPNRGVTHGPSHTDILAERLLITARSRKDPAQELGPLDSTSTIPPNVTPDLEIIIALMGVTGAGKSYFIREVTGNPEVEVSGDLCSCTSKVQSYSFGHKGAKITLVDTPGFDDSERTDTEVLQEIANWTSTTYREGQLLSGIIYLHPITHTRMEGSARRNLRLFQSLCGHEALENVFLTTTQWSNVNPVEAELREARLRNPDFWGALIDKGATLQRFDGTRESGFELIHRLMPNTRKTLDIQDQIVKQNMTLRETNAGKCINEELIAQEEKFKKKMESLEKQYQEVIKAKDDEMREMDDKMRALMDEKEKVQKELKKAVAGMKLLEELHAVEVKKREAREREEKATTCDWAVVAVATNDIAITADITGVVTSLKTKGRLILDINNQKEFESDTYEITINYKLSWHAVIRISTGKSGGFNARVGEIVLHGVHYRCKSGTTFTVGSQEFVIFSKG